MLILLSELEGEGSGSGARVLDSLRLASDFGREKGTNLKLSVSRIRPKFVFVLFIGHSFRLALVLFLFSFYVLVSYFYFGEYFGSMKMR